MGVTAEVKRAYLDTMFHFVDTGRAPHYTELSRSTGVSPDEALEIQKAAADAGVGSWFLEGTDLVECWAPFSNIPTNDFVSIDGSQRWYGQCGLEALAVTWVVPDREVRVESTCLDCGDVVTVVQLNGEVLTVDPPEAVGHMNEPFSSADWSTKASFI